jgi:uncharacterized protein (TIGR00304 family)
MNRWWLASIALFIASIILLVASVATGDGQFGIFVIFPFIVGSGPLAISGTALLFLAILCWFIGIWRTSKYEIDETATGDNAGTAQRNKFGGVVLIGPIPIVFGSNEKIAKNMLLLGVVLFVVMLIFFLFLVHPFF